MQRARRTRSWLAGLGGLLALGGVGAGPVGGVMAARWETGGEPPQVVKISFRREVRGQGTMSVTLGPEGERFRGEYLRVDDRTPLDRLSSIQVRWTDSAFEEFDRGPRGADWSGAVLSSEAFARKASGDVLATLSGERGGRIRCRFALKDPHAGLPGGASGACQIAGGGTLTVPAR